MKLRWLLLAAVIGLVLLSSLSVAQEQNDGGIDDIDVPLKTRLARKAKLSDIPTDENTVEAVNDDTVNPNIVPIPTRSERRAGPGENEIKRSGKRNTRVVDNDDITSKDPNDIIDNDAYVHFFSAFVASFSVIIVSEIGDKTFFIAAVMAMRHSRWEVFASAISALALMTVLSAAAGNILPNLLSPVWTHYASMVLFFFFGFKLLKQGWETDPNPKKNEELEEVEEELERSEHEEANPTGLEAQQKQQSLQVRVNKFFRRFFSAVFIQGFTMTFLAEWGDRSQIATIALAAARDPVGVTLGGILGHAICTGGAVISGKFAAARISERAVAYFGGSCFILCGLYSLFAGPDEVPV